MDFHNLQDQFQLLNNVLLGLLFFINWFTDFFTENLGTEGEIKIKIKFITSTLHFMKMVCNILYYSKTAKIDSNFKNISFNMLPSCGS